MKTDDLSRTIKSNIIIKLTVWGLMYVQFHNFCNQHPCHLSEDLFLLISKYCINFLASFTVYGKSETYSGDSIEFVTVF